MARLAKFVEKGRNDLHGDHLVNRRVVIGRIVNGIGPLITKALLRPPQNGAKYHELGFDTLLELIDCAAEHP